MILQPRYDRPGRRRSGAASLPALSPRSDADLRLSWAIKIVSERPRWFEVKVWSDVIYGSAAQLHRDSPAQFQGSSANLS